MVTLKLTYHSRQPKCSQIIVEKVAMFGGHILNGFRDIQLFSEGGRGRERGSKAYELEV